MRRLLTPIIAVVVLVATAGIASARLDGSNGAHGVSQLAPAGNLGQASVVLPDAAPPRDPAHPEAYGFRTSASFEQMLTGGTAASPAPASSAGASASVTVTAVVLPARTIVVDGHGHVTDIWSNTPDRGARSSLFVVHTGSASGPTAPLTAATWSQVRVLLSRANHASGHLYGHGA